MNRECWPEPRFRVLNKTGYRHRALCVRRRMFSSWWLDHNNIMTSFATLSLPSKLPIHGVRVLGSRWRRFVTSHSVNAANQRFTGGTTDTITTFRSDNGDDRVFYDREYRTIICDLRIAGVSAVVFCDNIDMSVVVSVWYETDSVSQSCKHWNPSPPHCTIQIRDVTRRTHFLALRLFSCEQLLYCNIYYIFFI